MGDLDRAYDPNNLRRAWRWIKSNPEATYKSYCRNLYTAYAVADEDALDDLRDRLRRGIYEPSHSTKIYFPKPSGILRPYSILTVEDQIVYQSLVNIVAERLLLRVRHRYLTEVFGHLYAGKSSAFFYRKWGTCYSKMNEACRDAFEAGYTYGASFDLTACYDSLDHGVLRHFLKDIGLDNDFCEHLTSLLSKWTATNHRIYHHHGIPQGPLSSGLLAEVALQHFDSHRGSFLLVRYVRYVDDIRLFAKSSDSLRKMLIQLDTLSKDVGLFPQSSKVHIHRIKDIDEELKSISNPPEPVLKRDVVDQERLRKRIIQLTPRFRVENATRFKYLLSCAEPTHKLNGRMWRIYERQPEFYANILRYFTKYVRLPISVADRLLDEIERTPLYHAIHSEMVRTVDGRLDDMRQTRLNRIIKKQWHPKTLSPELLATLGCVAVKNGLLTLRQTRYAATLVYDWWARSQIVAALNPDFIGEPSLESILNDLMRKDKENDVCMMSGQAVETHGVSIRSPRSDIQRRAAIVLREYGHIRRATGRPCGVDHALTQLLGSSVAGINWRRFFGRVIGMRSGKW